jgi:3-isopropylmalate dehydrogenase
LVRDERRKQMRRVHRVACLAGDGVGPELMAEASRTLRKVARMHGFTVDDAHVPFGSEALTRSGNPLPPATRSAVLTAEAVLVADLGEPALGGVAAQLDLRARMTQVLSKHGDFVLLSPLDADADEWTVERAFHLARRRRGRVVSVDGNDRWAALVRQTARRHDGVAVEQIGLADAMRALAFDPEPLDVAVTATAVAPALEELAAGDDGDDRLAALARLAGNGPSVFAPARRSSPDDAGHGVADPSSMLLASSLLLREGLGEDHAAETLASALRDARVKGSRPAAARRTLAATTRDFGDEVVSLLAASHANAEFVRSGVGSTEPPWSAGAGFAGAVAGESAA